MIEEGDNVVNFQKRNSDLNELRTKAEALKYQLAMKFQEALLIMDEISKQGLNVEFQFVCDHTGKWSIPNYKVFKLF